MTRRITMFLMKMYSFYTSIFKAKNNFGIHPLKALKMKFKGFTPDHYTLYNLAENDEKDYINENERWSTRNINGDYKVVLDDKLLFYEFFHKYITVPKNIFWVYHNQVLSLNGEQMSDQELMGKLREFKNIYLKPVVGGGGKGISKITVNGNYWINDEEVSEEQLLSFIKDNHQFIATPEVKQHPYAAKVFPRSTNTIRILTTYRLKDHKVSIPEALHRFGTSETEPVDNVSIGGLFALIDLETGRLSEAKNYKNQTFENHPDSDMPIRGVEVPRWDEIKSKCIEVASHFPYIPYMAWDIVVTEEGFEVIEINASTGITLFQMWEGKKDQELGQFFKEQGVID